MYVSNVGSAWNTVVSKHTYTHTNTHTISNHTYTRTHNQTHTHAHTYTPTHPNTHTHTHTHTHTQIEAIEGRTLLMSGVDLVDGTPIIDIKPYIPCYDAPFANGPALFLVFPFFCFFFPVSFFRAQNTYY